MRQAPAGEDDQMNQAKRMVVKCLSKMGLYPHVYFTYSPFKVLEYEAVIEAARPALTDDVLDVGCGGGLQTFLTASKAGRVFAVDPDSHYIEQARDTAGLLSEYPWIKFYTGTIFSNRYADDSFDLVLLICVLEHIKGYQSVLNEAYRILRPGGRIALTVDSLAGVDDALKEKHRQDHGVENYFSHLALHLALRDAGFNNVYTKALFTSDGARRLFEYGIKRGLKVLDTGGPITAPVGPSVLGRIFNVLGYLKSDLTEKKSQSKLGSFF